MAEVSRLPAAAQAQRERLTAEQNGGVANTPSGDPPANTPPVQSNDDGNTPPVTRVTLTKEEFNALQADRDRVLAAERRADAMKDDLDALRSRLTELEAGAKGGATASPAAPQAASQSQWDDTQIPLTDKEKADFEDDTIALMEKVALNVFRREANKLLSVVEGRVAKVEEVASQAVTTAGKVRTNTFTDKVREKVAEFGGNFDAIVRHQHWQAFTQAEDENTGYTYGEVITVNVERQRLEPVVKAFKKFYEKYIKDAPNTDGYAGAIPSASGVVETKDNGNKPPMLKYSDRQKLHKEYLARRISYEDYTREKEKYDIADREGRLDYAS